MKVQRFEDLECWKEARILVNVIYHTIDESYHSRQDSKTRTSQVVLKTEKTQKTKKTPNSFVLTPYAFFELLASSPASFFFDCRILDF